MVIEGTCCIARYPSPNWTRNQLSTMLYKFKLIKMSFIKFILYRCSRPPVQSSIRASPALPVAPERSSAECAECRPDICSGLSLALPQLLCYITNCTENRLTRQSSDTTHQNIHCEASYREYGLMNNESSESENTEIETHDI